MIGRQCYTIYTGMDTTCLYNQLLVLVICEDLPPVSTDNYALLRNIYVTLLLYSNAELHVIT